MSRFLQYVGPLGEPVYVRPDRVDGVREIAIYREGRPVRGALIVQANRETFRVLGSADAVVESIDQWHEEHDPKFEAMLPMTFDPQPLDAKVY